MDITCDQDIWGDVWGDVWGDICADGEAAAHRGALPTRFPTAPALALLRRQAALSHLTITDLACRLGIGRRGLHRLLARDWLTPAAADRIAVACSLHPCAIWPDWFGHPGLWTEPDAYDQSRLA
jgi:lambda repressor-like predicted transcriptional regulator